MCVSEAASYRTSLHRGEEEDLVDYDDSDIENEIGNENKKSSMEPMSKQTEKAQLDLFDDEGEEVPRPAEITRGVEIVDGDRNQVGDRADMNLGTTIPFATKTTQAATLIKALSDLLSNPAYSTSLGLVDPGSNVDLSFWASGLDFALNLKVVGTAKVKACKYGAECRNAKCTFDHGNANCPSKLTGAKPVKLCSMVNTNSGCSRGEACWFSHEAIGLACAHGELRATCPKGVYCFYKHSDDEVVLSVETVEGPSVQVEQGKGAKTEVVSRESSIDQVSLEAEEHKNSVAATGPSFSNDQAKMTCTPSPRAVKTSKIQNTGRKRVRSGEETAAPYAKERPQKLQCGANRSARQHLRERPDKDSRDGGRRVSTEDSRRVSGFRGSGRGRRRRGGGGSHRSADERTHDSRDETSKGLLSDRMTRS